LKISKKKNPPLVLSCPKTLCSQKIMFSALGINQVLYGGGDDSWYEKKKYCN